MELTMSNGLCEMSVNEILLLDGGEWSWSWSDFGASTAGNCVGGAAAGGVTAVCRRNILACCRSWSSWRSCMGSRKLFSRTALERIIWIILSYI